MNRARIVAGMLWGAIDIVLAAKLRGASALPPVLAYGHAIAVHYNAVTDGALESWLLHRSKRS